MFKLKVAVVSLMCLVVFLQVSQASTVFARWAVQTNGYYIRFSVENHYLGSCINRNAWHLGVLIKTTNSKLIFDGHIAAWSEGKWRKCAAIYESRTSWCKAWCNPTYKDIQGGWYDALLAVGVSAAVAWWLASVLTPVSVGCLAI